MANQGHKNKLYFTTALLQWNTEKNNRIMPWKNEKDPYKIWISEIILQQTKVQQGLEYYNRFIKAYPSVHHIAAAKENDVFKLWEGLGYYSRCKNIIASAKYISKELNGKFPENFKDIVQLKGIGNYTASAIASFAYNQPYAVLDGNVFRVLSRYFGIFSAIDGKDKTIYSSLANNLLDKINPGIYNQAIMDFGATICKPKLPLCVICPLKTKCFAFLNGLINTLPVKEKIITRRLRYFYYFLIEYEHKIYIRKRIAKDIWQNLNEFVLVETTKPATINALQKSALFTDILYTNNYTITSVSKMYKQQLTHQTITGQFLHIKITHRLKINGYQLTPVTQLDLLPFPKFIAAYLKEYKNVSLNLFA